MNDTIKDEMMKEVSLFLEANGISQDNKDTVKVVWKVSEKNPPYLNLTFKVSKYE